MTVIPNRVFLIFLLLLVCGSSGCALAGSGSGESPTMSPEPTVQPGDEIELKIWNEPEMSDTFAVAQTGTVILPKLGAVPVSQRAIGPLQDSLRTAFSEFLRNPSVEVTILRRVGVQGEVKQPGIYLVDLTMTLPDVLARAGGLTETGNRNDITIVRRETRIHYGVSDGGRFGVAELRSGDQVIVGQRNFLARNPTGVIGMLIGLTSLIITAVR
jgi:polysaccharide export outer membrane protein